IERHHRCRRNPGTDVEKIALHELDGSKPIALRRFLSRGGKVRRRRIDDERALHPAIEELERQRADARAHVEKDAVNVSCVDEQVAKQASGRPGSVPAIALQIALRPLLVELRADDITVSRTAGAHSSSRDSDGSVSPWAAARFGCTASAPSIPAGTSSWP